MKSSHPLQPTRLLGRLAPQFYLKVYLLNFSFKKSPFLSCSSIKNIVVFFFLNWWIFKKFRAKFFYSEQLAFLGLCKWPQQIWA